MNKKYKLKRTKKIGGYFSFLTRKKKEESRDTEIFNPLEKKNKVISAKTSRIIQGNNIPSNNIPEQISITPKSLQKLPTEILDINYNTPIINNDSINIFSEQAGVSVPTGQDRFISSITSKNLSEKIRNIKRHSFHYYETSIMKKLKEILVENTYFVSKEMKEFFNFFYVNVHDSLLRKFIIKNIVPCVICFKCNSNIKSDAYFACQDKQNLPKHIFCVNCVVNDISTYLLDLVFNILNVTINENEYFVTINENEYFLENKIKSSLIAKFIQKEFFLKKILEVCSISDYENDYVETIVKNKNIIVKYIFEKKEKFNDNLNNDDIVNLINMLKTTTPICAFCEHKTKKQNYIIYKPEFVITCLFDSIKYLIENNFNTNNIKEKNKKLAKLEYLLKPNN